MDNLAEILSALANTRNGISRATAFGPTVSDWPEDNSVGWYEWPFGQVLFWDGEGWVK